MGGHLVDPAGHPGIGVAGDERHRPAVVARALGRVPGRGVAGAVIDEVQRRVVGEPAPAAGAARPPLVALPALQRGVLADRATEFGGRLRIDQHVGIRPGGVGAPETSSAGLIVRGDVAAGPVLAPRQPDDQRAADRQDRGGVGLAASRIAVPHRPQHPAGLRIEGHHGGVGLLQEQPPVRVGQPAGDRVAAHHGDDARVLPRGVAPQDLPALVEIEGVDRIGERGVHEHHVPDHDRRALVAAQHAGGEGPGDLEAPDIAGVDPVEVGIAGVGVVEGLEHRPFGREGWAGQKGERHSREGRNAHPGASSSGRSGRGGLIHRTAAEIPARPVRRTAPRLRRHASCPGAGRFAHATGQSVRAAHPGRLGLPDPGSNARDWEDVSMVGDAGDRAQRRGGGGRGPAPSPP